MIDELMLLLQQGANEIPRMHSKLGLQIDILMYTSLPRKVLKSIIAKIFIHIHLVHGRAYNSIVWLVFPWRDYAIEIQDEKFSHEVSLCYAL